MPIVALPFAVLFGPRIECDEDGLNCTRAARFALDLGVELDDPLGYYLRYGLRTTWHRRGSVVGIGYGFGVAYRISGSALESIAPSPEISVTFGRCCAPGFLQFNARAELTFEGPRFVLLGGFILH